MEPILVAQCISKPENYYFQIDNFHFQVKFLSFYVVKLRIFKLNFDSDHILPHQPHYVYQLIWNLGLMMGIVVSNPS